MVRIPKRNSHNLYFCALLLPNRATAKPLFTRASSYPALTLLSCLFSPFYFTTHYTFPFSRHTPPTSFFRLLVFPLLLSPLLLELVLSSTSCLPSSTNPTSSAFARHACTEHLGATDCSIRARQKYDGSHEMVVPVHTWHFTCDLDLCHVPGASRPHS
jgi:hypothetical protein